MKISRKRRRQWIGAAVGLLATVSTYTVISLPANEEMLSLGPMNTGHEDLSCETCHTPASGNTFQQLQANVLFTLGMRKTKADFGMENVDRAKCMDCHDRPNDRHPLYRFEETRFAPARKNLNVTECEGCHMEHNEVRLTQTNIGYCENCHEETNLKHDPLEISHAELVANDMWTTCLQCHDFHGNHVYEAAESMKDTISIQTVRAYFDGGKSPYSDVKEYYPLSEEEWRKRRKKK